MALSRFGRSASSVSILLSVGQMLLGCGFLFGEPNPPSSPGAQPKAPPSDCEAPCELHLRVKTSEATNGGGAVQVLVRETTAVDFPRESYQDLVASLSMPSDPRTRLWQAIAPGQSADHVVSYPATGELAVYFLFFRPGERWRYLLLGRDVRRLEVRLGLNGIETIHPTKRRRP
ncbi:MAG: hypothetical protein RJA70_1063 [Pseudomonadota bacterium]